jgi:hypothetical protein
MNEDSSGQSRRGKIVMELVGQKAWRPDQEHRGNRIRADKSKHEQNHGR